MSWASKAWKRVTNSVSNVASSSAVKSATMAFANPLVYQDVVGARVAGGDVNANALAADPTKYSTSEWADLAAFNAALAAGAATGGATSALAYTSPAAAAAGAAPLGTVAGSVGGALAVGAGTYGAAAGTKQLTETGAPDAGTTPPDVNESNDPDLAAQFKRIRQGARALGRAGTIKYKGASKLGLGDQVLGDSLSLTGS